MGDELSRLIEEQEKDIAAGDYQAPERARTDSSTGSVPFLSVDRFKDETGTGDDPAVAGVALSAEEEYLAGLEGEGPDYETEVLGRLTEDERTLYIRVFGEGLSLRDLEALTGRSKSSQLRDVARLRVRLQEVLEEVVA